MGWKFNIIATLKLFNGNTAIECAMLSENIYHLDCNTRNSLCLKSRLPVVQIIK